MDTSSLMEQILSKDNLNAAYLQVVRNKGAAGIDGMTVEGLGAYLSKNGEIIREQLRTRKYKPQPVRRCGDTKARRWNKEPWSANGGRQLCTAGGSTGAHSDI
jgi:hypothetical protein